LELDDSAATDGNEEMEMVVYREIVQVKHDRSYPYSDAK
jgi:hypothetical protein